jgi:hypothetical protein
MGLAGSAAPASAHPAEQEVSRDLNTPFDTSHLELAGHLVGERIEKVTMEATSEYVRREGA